METNKAKLEPLKNIANETLKDITSTKETFKSFLKFQANLYKYSFCETLLIYKQNPYATACATLSQWNKVGRRVHKGHKSIKVFENNSSKIKYLFDISDTYGKEFTYKVKQEIPSEKEEDLLKSFNVELYSDNFSKNFKWCIENYVTEYFDELTPNFNYTNKNNAIFSDDKFKKTISECVGYMLCERFSIPKGVYDKEISFTELSRYSAEHIYTLGTVAQYISKKTITEINYVLEERKNSNEREVNRRKMWVQGIDSRRSNGTSRRGDNSYREVRTNVDEFHGRSLSLEKDFSNIGSVVGRNGIASGGRSNKYVDYTTESIHEEQSTTERKLYGDFELRNSNVQSNRGDSIERNSLQREIEKPLEESLNKGSSFIEKKEEVSWTKESVEEDFTNENITNFNIVSDKSLGFASGKKKLRQNLEAIKLLNKIESEDRKATSNEQSVLAKYSGFGGIPQVFESENEKWINEYNELKNLLSDNEYELAKNSTLNAHYTSSQIVKFMYNGISRLGFKGGNILEPAMGTGNFFGNLPEYLKDTTKLYGVELDDITGRIAKQLYPKANIEIAGFENAKIRDNSFDLAIGNLPFGNYKVYDKKMNEYDFLIHDYFISKSIDKIKSNGIMAFITSKGTMDKAECSARKYISDRAELLCAIRLPNDAFKECANTEVTTDILFFKKRERVIDSNENWIYTGLYNTKNNEQATINQYFIDNPHMMLGELSVESSRYGKETTLLPYKNENLNDLLQHTISFLPKNITYNVDTLDELDDDVVLSHPNVKNYCYTVIGDKIYQREDFVMKPVELSKNNFDRVKSLIEIRNVAKNLLEIQLNNCSDLELSNNQERLNIIYEKFVKEYGNLNSRYNVKLFKDDSEFPLLSSLEEVKYNEEVVKADIFSKRTLLPRKTFENVETSIHALSVCLYEKGKVDIDYMASLVNKENEEVIEDLNGIIFKNPKYKIEEKDWITADEYLSGDVVGKLEVARRYLTDDTIYEYNIQALLAVQPVKLQAHEIDVRIGSSWIDSRYYKRFIVEHFKGSTVEVNYSELTNGWKIDKPKNKSSVEATLLYGTSRMDAYNLMETLLNQGNPKIFDTLEDSNGSKRKVLNKSETLAIKNKASKLNDDFTKWIFADEKRRNDLVAKYNRLFNHERVRQYDGSFLEFEGMNPNIKLKDHQKDAVARILFGGNTLLAHCVGAGKTYTMATAAMEMKRLGIANKPCIVVPNHLINQWANEFKRLYPNASILTATKNDFEKQKRQRFCARIATGEWDAIIIGHSSFGKIPISVERQEMKIKKDLEEAKDTMRHHKLGISNRAKTKDIARCIKNLEVKLKKLNDSPKDNLINFESLGIDALFVDEAHMFKNKFMFTKMGNIAGLSKTSSQKSYDMELKCDYINEINNSERNVVFATATPISNSMVEIYAMQSYLQKNVLAEKGLNHFDNWASNFGEVVSTLELSTSGKGFRLKERFAKFTNLPELMNLYLRIADIQTSDTLKLPVPEIETGKPITIATEASPSQKALVDVLVQLSEQINSKTISAENYNMLCVTNDGRLGALDMRSVNIEKFKTLSNLYGIDISGMKNDDYEFSKVNACINKVFEVYKDTGKDKSTQMIFCDLSTPKSKVANVSVNTKKSFSVYEDIKEKLLGKGVKEDEIAFIHDAKTDEEKEKLFSKMRSGSLRILIGSTPRMGAGTNCQTKLIAEHHLDCPWRPSDYEQRLGRIVRQGNENDLVQVYNYVTKSTFDAYLWQIIETKQKFIGQVMSRKNQSRTMEDIDGMALTYAEVKAISTGNPLIKRKMELDIEVQRLQVLEGQYFAMKCSMQNKISKDFPVKIANLESLIKSYKSDIALYKENNNDFNVQLGVEKYYDKKEATKMLFKLINDKKHINNEIGIFKGFKIIPQENNPIEKPKILLKGSTSHLIELSRSEIKSIEKIENYINSLPSKVEVLKEDLNNYKREIEVLKCQVEEPFEHEDKLLKLKEELNFINNELDIGKEDENCLVDENISSEISFEIKSEMEMEEIEEIEI